MTVEDDQNCSGKMPSSGTCFIFSFTQWGFSCSDSNSTFLLLSFSPTFVFQLLIFWLVPLSPFLSIILFIWLSSNLFQMIFLIDWTSTSIQLSSLFLQFKLPSPISRQILPILVHFLILKLIHPIQLVVCFQSSSSNSPLHTVLISITPKSLLLLLPTSFISFSIAPLHYSISKF